MCHPLEKGINWRERRMQQVVFYRLEDKTRFWRNWRRGEDLSVSLSAFLYIVIWLFFTFIYVFFSFYPKIFLCICYGFHVSVFMEFLTMGMGMSMFLMPSLGLFPSVYLFSPVILCQFLRYLMKFHFILLLFLRKDLFSNEKRKWI